MKQRKVCPWLQLFSSEPKLREIVCQHFLGNLGITSIKKLISIFAAIDHHSSKLLSDVPSFNSHNCVLPTNNSFCSHVFHASPSTVQLLDCIPLVQVVTARVVKTFLILHVCVIHLGFPHKFQHPESHR